MSNLDTILQYLLKDGILSKTAITYSLAKQSSGAAGYFGGAISLDFTPLFMTITTPSISSSKGLQLTPIYLTNEAYYVNYHSPNTMSDSVKLTITFYGIK